jgi:hypothetical protein
MAIVNLSGVSWSSISKVNGIAKASISKVSGIEAASGPPIQTATLSATKYVVYTAGNPSWTVAVNALSSIYSSTFNLAADASAVPGRTGTSYFNTRTNLQFNLSSYSAYTILSAKLKINVTTIDTSATPNEVYVLDLGGNTFSFPTTNDADYSLVYQQGNFDEYAYDSITTTGLHELGFSAAALTTANTYPTAYSMAILTYQDRNDTAPALNTFYSVYFDTPELEITYQ